jgi:hypothetical protein
MPVQQWSHDFVAVNCVLNWHAIICSDTFTFTDHAPGKFEIASSTVFSYTTGPRPSSQEPASGAIGRPFKLIVPEAIALDEQAPVAARTGGRREVRWRPRVGHALGDSQLLRIQAIRYRIYAGTMRGRRERKGWED